jgi:hypothetical protein
MAGMQRFRGVHYTEEGPIESFSGLYPHVPDYHFQPTASTQRSSPFTLNPSLTHISTSNPVAMPSLARSTAAQLDLAGLRLTPSRRGKMKMQYIERLDLDTRVPSTVGRAYALTLLASVWAFKEGFEVRLSFACMLGLT